MRTCTHTHTHTHTLMSVLLRARLCCFFFSGTWVILSRNSSSLSSLQSFVSLCHSLFFFSSCFYFHVLFFNPFWLFSLFVSTRSLPHSFSFSLVAANSGRILWGSRIRGFSPFPFLLPYVRFPWNMMPFFSWGEITWQAGLTHVLSWQEVVLGSACLSSGTPTFLSKCFQVVWLSASLLQRQLDCFRFPQDKIRVYSFI